nr:coiled-coil-helix-coiled-coil-helix domain-containing protein 7 [Biomphalaria glabrata]
MPEEKSKLKFVDNTARSAEIAAEKAKTDPCLAENEMTLRCLDDNGYDRSKCSDFFLNYNNCRKFWSWVTSQRKQQGISPYLPHPEDREKVKQEYLPKMLNKSL